MKSNEILANIIRNFFVIFGVIVLITALLNPSHEFTSNEILFVVVFAFLSDLTALVFWSKNELSDKSRIIWKVLHFLLIEIIVLSFGNILGFVSGLTQNIIFGSEIVGIYAIVSWVDWLIDKKTANSINDRLKKMRSNEKND